MSGARLTGLDDFASNFDGFALEGEKFCGVGGCDNRCFDRRFLRDAQGEKGYGSDKKGEEEVAFCEEIFGNFGHVRASDVRFFQAA